LRYANDIPINFADYVGIVIFVAAAILGWVRFIRNGGNQPQETVWWALVAELSGFDMLRQNTF
jgi:hypothetical protein